jgi:hypothetical protein
MGRSGFGDVDRGQSIRSGPNQVSPSPTALCSLRGKARPAVAFSLDPYMEKTPTSVGTVRWSASTRVISYGETFSRSQKELVTRLRSKEHGHWTVEVLIKLIPPYRPRNHFGNVPQIFQAGAGAVWTKHSRFSWYCSWRGLTALVRGGTHLPLLAGGCCLAMTLSLILS